MAPIPSVPGPGARPREHRFGSGVGAAVERQRCGAECHPMIDCPMTEDCPAYDHDAQMCLVHPGDCEFSPADGEAARSVDTLEILTPDTSVDVLPG